MPAYQRDTRVDVKKALRTAQSHLPALKTAKDVFYRQARRVLRVPHESDFRVLASLLRQPGEVLVDVGANHGQSIESIRLFQPDASIVAFEANPMLAEALVRRYRATDCVRIEPVGLSDVDGAFALNVPSYAGFCYDGLASIDQVKAEDWLGPGTIYFFNKDKLTVRKLACETRRLDAFNLTPAFLKIDVQGLEYRVLAGARGTIARCRPAILVEDFETDPRMASFAGEMGYAPFHCAADKVAPGLGPGPNTLLLPSDKPRFRT